MDLPHQLSTRGDGPARIALLDQIAAQLAEHGWSSGDVFKIQMAVEESVSNAFQHGNRNGELGDVDIAWSVDGAEFHLRVTDCGPGFQESSVPDPTDEVNIEGASGRGLLLLKSFMDHLEYRLDGRQVCMSKRKESEKLG